MTSDFLCALQIRKSTIFITFFQFLFLYWKLRAKNGPANIKWEFRSIFDDAVECSSFSIWLNKD